MHVIATAGHVDHGKSALLRALTGMEPDRWTEEQQRGLTIDLGFVWTGGERGRIAFVDVPGHERFIGNMLAGVGPVPAVLFVVAADEGWKPQSAEHLMALHALGVRHGVLAVTKTDLIEPELAAEEALDEIRGTSLGEIPWVGVSVRAGEGVSRLRAALDDVVAGLPDGEASAPVRLWIDRGFTMRGAGLVVTGTLAAGSIRTGDTLELARTAKPYVVREVQSLNQCIGEANGVTRVALNLRGARRGELGRGDALLTPGSYHCARVVDVRTRLCSSDDLPSALLAHVGTAMVTVAARPLGGDTARLTLRTATPLRGGERMVLRSSGRVIGGAVVLDIDPPVLNRRGAGRQRAAELEAFPDVPDGRSELRRRGVVRASTLRVIGVQPPTTPLAGDWLVDTDLAESLRGRLRALADQRASDPSASPWHVEEMRRALDLPDVCLVRPLVTPPLVVRDGKIVTVDAPDTLAPAVRESVAELARRMVDRDFAVCTEEKLRAIGLSPADVAAAVRSGRLVRLAPDMVLLPETIAQAVSVLGGMPQPFTAGQAREALGTSRKIIIQLLEYLAAQGKTRRTADGRHTATDD